MRWLLTGASFPDLSTSCAELTVSGNGAPGTDIVFALTGAAPDTFAVLVIGDTKGSFTQTFGPNGTLELGIVPPFTPLPMHFTDGNGDASKTIRVPHNWPHVLDLLAQALSITHTVTAPPPPGVHPNVFTFCTSDVEPFHVGN